jgi:hypothetical protein
MAGGRLWGQAAAGLVYFPPGQIAKNEIEKGLSHGFFSAFVS